MAGASLAAAVAAGSAGAAAVAAAVAESAGAAAVAASLAGVGLAAAAVEELSWAKPARLPATNPTSVSERSMRFMLIKGTDSYQALTE